jgi:SSS family solute:Na+ symporter
MIFTGLDYLIIGIFLIITLVVGLSFRKSAEKDLTSFFLAGRNLPWWLAGISMVATTFAADTPLAVTELIAKNGISSNWLWWNMMAGGMLTTFFFAKQWRRANVLTDLEFIELRYSGKAAAFLRGFRAIYFGLFMNALVIGWVNLAMMSLLIVFFPALADHLLLSITALMGLVVIYSSLSGLKGIAFVDLIQFSIAMGGCIILAFLVLYSDDVGGISGLKDKLPTATLNFLPNIGESKTQGVLTLSLGSFIAFGLFQWWSSWYPGAEPGGGGYIAQRIMSSKDEKSALFATLFFQVAHYCIRPWPWVIVALCSLVLYPDLPPNESRLGFVYVMRDFLPAGLKGLLFVAFLSAYMSTISTQLNWGASYLMNDFYKRFFKVDPKRDIHFSRLITVIVMSIAIIITSKIESISGVWSFIIECGAGLGLVLILRWYWSRINVWSEITASVVPLLCYAIMKFILVEYDASWGKGILEDSKAFFYTVVITTISWIGVTLITPKETDNTLNNFISQTRPNGLWNGKIIGKDILVKNLVSWAVAIALGYSILFGIGFLVFKEWISFIPAFLITLVSILILRRNIVG